MRGIWEEVAVRAVGRLRDRGKGPRVALSTLRWRLRLGETGLCERCPGTAAPHPSGLVPGFPWTHRAYTQDTSFRAPASN